MKSSVQKVMQSVLEKLVSDGKEFGIQFAAYHNGELIVDTWAGVMDMQSRRKVDGTTLFPAFSSFKGVIATLVHILAEKGKLDYDMKISDVWPEFGVNGKKTSPCVTRSMTVRAALSVKKRQLAGYRRIQAIVLQCYTKRLDYSKIRGGDLFYRPY